MVQAMDVEMVKKHLLTSVVVRGVVIRIFRTESKILSDLRDGT